MTTAVSRLYIAMDARMTDGFGKDLEKMSHCLTKERIAWRACGKP
jgi:hypothetical protein